LSQQLGGLDAFEAEEHRIEQRKQHLADAVAIVSLYYPKLHRNCVYETNRSEKAMKQVYSSVMGEASSIEAYPKLSRSSCHYTEPYPMGIVQCKKESGLFWPWDNGYGYPLPKTITPVSGLLKWRAF
jgi:hypothetical protein